MDELVLYNDYIISYKQVKSSGIGTHLSDEKDWKMFLKKYQRLTDQKFKKTKLNQVNKR